MKLPEIQQQAMQARMSLILGADNYDRTGKDPGAISASRNVSQRALAIGRTEREIGIAYNVAYGLLTEKRVEIGIA